MTNRDGSPDRYEQERLENVRIQREAIAVNVLAGLLASGYRPPASVAIAQTMEYTDELIAQLARP